MHAPARSRKMRGPGCPGVVKATKENRLRKSRRARCIREQSDMVLLLCAYLLQVVLLSLLARVQEILQARRCALQKVVPRRQLLNLPVDLDKLRITEEMITDQRPFLIVVVIVDFDAWRRAASGVGTLCAPARYVAACRAQLSPTRITVLSSRRECSSDSRRGTSSLRIEQPRDVSAALTFGRRPA